jgi:gliding motility-associated-like protein
MNMKCKYLFKLLIFSILGFVLSFDALAQKEGNIWYFGRQAGLSFASGSPVAISDGVIQTDEGVATICTKNGSLLMYTDGIKAWDKDHKQMNQTIVNPMYGDPSATQSGVIVPQPVRGSRYYIFAVGDDGGRLSYSIVDTNITSTGTKGDIIPSEHRKILLAASCEKITAVKHANKVDTWIIAHDWGNNKFMVYLLRSTGLVTTPVVSAVGTPVGPTTSKANVGYSKGCLKVSPDGSKLVNPIVGSQATNTDGFWELYDFNNQTGVISNPMIFNPANKPAAISGYDGIYGAEFSPNGRFLYLGCRRTGGGVNDRIYQFDMLAGNRTLADINASGVEVAPSSGGGITNSYGTMQIGPDGRIYIARYQTTGTSYLSIIAKPNCKGTACTFINNGINLSSGKFSRWGLPTMISSYFSKPEFEFGDPDPNNYGLCIGDSTQFWMADTAGLDSVKWIFGDPNSGAANFSSLLSPKHRFSRDSTYQVQAIMFRRGSFSCLLDTVKQFVTIYPKPSINLGRDTTLCAGESHFMNALTDKATYLWHNATTGPNFTATKSDTVWVQLRIGGCFGSDTVIIKVANFPTPNLGSDTVICSIDSILKIPGKAETFLWDNNATDTFRKIKAAGTYWVEMANYRCKSRDSVVITVSSIPTFNLGRDSTLCTNDSLRLNVKLPHSTNKFLWSNSTTDSTILVKSPGGKFWVRATDSLCQYSDTVVVSFSSPKPLEIGADRIICDGQTVNINAGIPGVTKYKWHDNSTDSIFKAKTAGKIWVSVFDGFCNLSDTTNIFVKTPASFKLGNDTILCTGTVFNPMQYTIPGYSQAWNGNPLKSDTNITVSGKYWVDVRDVPDQKCLTTDTIIVAFQLPKSFNLGNDTILCLGQVVNLNANSVAPVKSAVWNDAVTGLTRTNNNTMVKHKLTINDGVCTSADSINISYKPALNINLGPDVQLCDLATLNKDITDPNATLYEWTTATGALLGTANTYTINSPGGTFVARISDNLCSKSDTFTVTYYNTPVVDLGLDQILCDDATFDYDFTPIDADNALWNNGTSGRTFQVTQEGTYWFRASKGNCTDADTVVFLYTTAPIVNFGFRDTSLCEPTWFNFDFTFPHTTYLWSDGSNQSTNRINSKGTHWVVATNVCGTDSASFNIEIDEFGCFVIFPNAFSPNGNLVNDIFRPIGNVLEFLEMNIYNRWGERIFTGPAAAGWNGEIQGVPAPQGVYYYNVTYRKISGGYPRRYTDNGTVHLVR